MEQAAAKFTSHVFPGETLAVSAWKEGDVIQFSTSTKERGKEVCAGFVRIAPSAKL